MKNWGPPIYLVVTAIVLLVTLTSVSLTSGNNAALIKGSMTDHRDGQTYSVSRLTPGLLWMTENLNYNVPGSICDENKPRNCKRYGRIYTRAQAENACPNGWRLPTNSEFSALINQFGGEQNAYRHLIEGGSSRFNAKLFGYWQGERPISNRSDGFYWSSNVKENGGGWVLFIDSSRGGSVSVRRIDSDTNQGSCRCVQNN